jgi:putative ABC transport system substrate-binding protein
MLGAAPAIAQQNLGVRRIAVVITELLPPRPPEFDESRTFRGPYFERLAALGYQRGRNLEVRNFSRTTDEVTDPTSAWRAGMVAEALAWKPDLLFVQSTGGALLLRDVTRGVPIVFANLQDPVAAGLVATLARPGGNITGAATHYDGVALKRLELVAEALPKARRVVLLSNRRGGGIPARMQEVLDETARRLGLALARIDVEAIPEGLCGAVDAVRRERPDALMTYGNFTVPLVAPNIPGATPDDMGLRWMSRGYGMCLAWLQRQARAPVFDDSTDSVPHGVAFSLGEDQFDSFRRAADVSARILAGARPADVPVDAQMRVTLHVNRRSLRQLGVAPPNSVLVRADRVVD